MHVALCGDSIFDNRSYVGATEPDVIEQVRERLPAGSRATLLAVDGDITAGVPAQLERLSADASHIFVSTGGNDALGHLEVLERSVPSVADALDTLVAVAAAFERQYQGMLEIVRGRGLPTAVCTVYFPRFDCEDLSRLNDFGLGAIPRQEREALQRRASAALTLFNDAIIRVALAAGVPVLDLRLIFSEDADYANPIEPSARGGAKLANVIVRVVEEHDFARGRTEVFV